MIQSRRFLYLIVILFATTFVALLVTSKIFILESFEKIEEKQIHRNVERVLDAVQNEVAAQERNTIDWANWDDSFTFLANGNPHHEQRNLTSQAYVGLKIHVIVYVRSDGLIMFGKTNYRSDGSLYPVSESLKRHLLPDGPLLKESRRRKNVSGMLLLPEGPLMVSIRPVLDSNLKGPSPGFILMGRYLDVAEFSRIAQLSHNAVSFHPINNGTLSSVAGIIERYPEGSPPVLVRAAANDRMNGFGLLRDIYGRPALLACVDVPREVYGKGKEAVIYFLAWIMGILSVALLAGYILSRKLARSRMERRESDARYRALILQTSDGVLMIDPTRWNILEANEALQKMLDYRETELLSMTLYDIVAGDCASIESDINDLKEGKPCRTAELSFRQRKGSPLCAEMSANIISYDDKKVLCLFVRDVTDRKRMEEERREAATELLEAKEDLERRISERTAELSETNEKLKTDIEERQKAEEALWKSESILRKVFEAIPDLFSVIDRDQRIVHSNWHGTFSSVPERLRSAHPFCYEAQYPDQVGPCDPCHASEVFRTGKPAFREEFSPCLGHVEVRMYPIFDEAGDVVMVTVHVRDITDRKNLEEEMLKAQKLESLGVLAGGIAHDFNNLLTGILGNISLAKMLTDPESKVYARLDEAERASRRAGDLTRQLLTFSKGGAPVKTTASIEQLIMDSVSFVLSGSNVRCEFHLPKGIWPVEVDEGQMSQVINNLIINADQAMPNGGVITVSTENVVIDEKGSLPLPPGRYVRISIRDQGIGITESHIAKIFDPYFSTKEKGSGIGLTTVYSIIKKHDGHITVESKVGAGSVFYIYLPASENKPAAKEKKEEAELQGEGRILVMDDDEIIREVAGVILGHLGYNTVYCRDGAEAVEEYKKAMETGESFAAVLMDLTIPGGMGGKEAMKCLLELDPQARGIVSSGYSNDPILAHYRDYGFSGVVLKPYDMEELGRTLHKIIKQ